jgi:hypothetical protein
LVVRVTFLYFSVTNIRYLYSLGHINVESKEKGMPFNVNCLATPGNSRHISCGFKVYGQGYPCTGIQHQLVNLEDVC